MRRRGAVPLSAENTSPAASRPPPRPLTPCRSTRLPPPTSAAWPPPAPPPPCAPRRSNAARRAVEPRRLLPPRPPRHHCGPRAAGVRRRLPADSNRRSNRRSRRHRLPLVRRGSGGSGDARLTAPVVCSSCSIVIVRATVGTGASARGAAASAAACSCPCPCPSCRRVSGHKRIIASKITNDERSPSPPRPSPRQES
jgi:hypothetical protein